MSKKDAAIYLRAAEIVDGGEGQYPGSCCAIQRVAKPTDDDCYCVSEAHPAVTKYRLRFHPDHEERVVLWGDFWPDPKGCRVLALCFAAAMAETSDL